LQEQEELSRISNTATETLTEIEKIPSDVVSDRATAQRDIISQAGAELAVIKKEITISSEVNKIIQDIDDGKLIVPDYYNNNIAWVLSGHITNGAFLTSYHSFVDQGLIHAPITEPITVTPPPEQKIIYWIIKSTPPDRSGKQIEISTSDKIQLEGQGWVFSLTEPDKPEPPALLSANIKISFTNPNIGGFSSSIPIDDIDKLQILTNSAPEWKYTLIGTSTNQSISTLSGLINNINDLLASVEPDEPEPDEPDITITDNMVTQQLINFNIVNGRAVGSIKFVATNNFNPYYYGQNIVNIIQFKDPNGAKFGVVKENRLNFTETERDEVISYDEDMQGNTRATVESVVWSSAITPTPFSKMYSIEISEAEPPKPLTTGFMGAGVAGAIAGLVLIGFIADHKRGK